MVLELMTVTQFLLSGDNQARFISDLRAIVVATADVPLEELMPLLEKATPHLKSICRRCWQTIEGTSEPLVFELPQEAIEHTAKNMVQEVFGGYGDSDYLLLQSEIEVLIYDWLTKVENSLDVIVNIKPKS